jgi:hypothetical protein
MIEILCFDDPQFDCEPVDVHTRLEILSRTRPRTIEVIAIAFGQCRRMPLVTLVIEKYGAWLGWVELQDF